MNTRRIIWTALLALSMVVTACAKKAPKTSDVNANPVATPAPVLARLRESAAQTLAAPEIVTRLHGQGLELRAMRADEMLGTERQQVIEPVVAELREPARRVRQGLEAVELVVADPGVLHAVVERAGGHDVAQRGGDLAHGARRERARGQRQVRELRRIEGAAEQADALGHGRPV